MAIKKFILLALLSFIPIVPLIIYAHTSDFDHLKIKSQKVAFICDHKGCPTLAALQIFFRQEYSSNDLIVSYAKRGGKSDEMYIVCSKNEPQKPIYYVKISSYNKTTQKLIAIQQGFIGQQFIQACYNNSMETNVFKQFPVVVWLEKLLVYTNPQGYEKFIEVTRAADGQLLTTILEVKDASTIEQCSYAIGQALATFHQIFMKYPNPIDPATWTTVLHGDFILYNILVNPKSKQVFFIDNEYMREESILDDLFQPLIGLNVYQYLARRPSRWPMHLKHCIAFLKGYIESFDEDKRPLLAAYIKTNLTSIPKPNITRWLQQYRIPTQHFNEQEFKKIIFNYLNSI